MSIKAVITGMKRLKNTQNEIKALEVVGDELSSGSIVVGQWYSATTTKPIQIDEFTPFQGNVKFQINSDSVVECIGLSRNGYHRFFFIIDLATVGTFTHKAVLSADEAKTCKRDFYHDFHQNREW